MGQRIRSKKNRNSVKGVAVKRTGANNPNNTIKIGNVTLKGSGKSLETSNKNRTKKKRKRK